MTLSYVLRTHWLNGLGVGWEQGSNVEAARPIWMLLHLSRREVSMVWMRVGNRR